MKLVFLLFYYYIVFLKSELRNRNRNKYVRTILNFLVRPFSLYNRISTL